MPIITTAAIAQFIGAGLAAAGWSAVEESALKPAMQPGVDGVKALLERGSKRRKANKALRDAVKTAFEAIGTPQGDGDVSGYALRLGFDKLHGMGTSAAQKREMVARAALLMHSPNPDEIPDDVYETLRWPTKHRAELAQFLYALRQALADNEEWGALLNYSEQEAVRNYLSLLIGSQRRMEMMLAALLAYQGIAPGDEDGTALAHYLDFVRDRYRLLSFLFVKSARRRNIKEAELDAVFVPLQVHDPEHDGTGDEQRVLRASRRRQPEMDEAEMAHEKFTRPMTIDEVLAKYPIFILRGNPGSGKSTLLRYMALSFARNEARERLDWPHEELLPILVPLSNFGRYLQTHPYNNNAPRPLRQFIEEYFRDQDLTFPPGFFHNRLQKGGCLLLLDGLDEVATRDLRADVAQIITAFIDRYDKSGNRFVLASRPKGYDDAALFLPKPVVCTVQDMTPEGRDVLVHKLLRQFEGSRKTQNAEIADLLQDIRRKDKVDDLSRNPLFCTILLLVYKFLGARLPERRVDVYAEVVNLMLGSWELHRSRKEGAVGSREVLLYDGTSREWNDENDAKEARERALVHIADWMQREGKVEVSRKLVEAELADYYEQEEGAPTDEKEAWATGFLEIAHRQSGLYVAKDPETFAFSHRSFLEYLAATALIDQREEAMQETILQHVAAKWWHDVIVLAAAHPDLKTKRRNWFFDLLLQNEHLVLAGECAVDAGKRLPPPMQNKVLTRLHAQMTNIELEPKERFAAAYQWDALGGPPQDVDKWLKCPACGDGKEDLLVGKYPITNAQFALFMAADGYEKAKFWDGEESADWKWRMAGKRSFSDKGTGQPEFWRDTRFGRERRGFPVVGVSWYEAQAYCRWLTHLLERLLDEDEAVTAA
ncbi:MAG: SUMF1/EgtB/PvdO family nonheme iron enzyme, partial [Chloroflexi bacterium]|nr:SUMF1/EgtB/PvdO family nonheme iron enzyme [Chloroflexota bacterium]